MTQIRLLARTFFARFFESDLMPPGLPQAQLVIGSLVVLAAPGLLLPMRFGMKYSALVVNFPHELPRVLLMDRLLFITLAMTAMGFVALVVWEGVFPDRRDARILGALPLTGRVLICGRLLALAALGGIFLLGVNAVPTVMYGPIMSAFGGATNVIRGALAHLIATSAAGAFVFFSLIALQGALLNLAGRRVAERLSVILQVIFVVALLQMIFFLPRMGSLLRADLRTSAADPLVSWVPSLWFLGLYEALGGRPGEGAYGFAGYAVLATLAALAGAAGLIILTHARLVRVALEAREVGGRTGRILAPLVRRISDLRWRRPVERAAFEFTLRTLVRSRTHRMLMAMYVGIAVALVISGLVPLLLRDGLDTFMHPDAALLSAPLVIGFFALVGIRVVLTIPVEPKANWIIRLIEPSDRAAATDGVRNAMLIGGALPITLLAGGSAAVLWGSRPAMVHTIVCALMSWMLIEVLLLRLGKLPFTSTFMPGRGRLRTRWPLYLMAFTNYSFTTASLEPMFMQQPRALAIFAAVIAGVALVVRAIRIYEVRALPGFTFEEEDPDAMFQGFRLSEGLAAQSRRAEL